MRLTWPQRAALEEAATGGCDLRRVSEPMRQRLIDLAMMDPPVVEVEADRVTATDLGRAALAQSVEKK